MTTEEAIKTLEDGAWWDSLPQDMSDADMNPLQDALDTAIAALRAQQKEAEKGCEQCSGVLYRQTDSGKIVPLEQYCGEKITPPCYQPDGDGCAYQIYGDDNDEPIDRCKSCPLCYSDKVRYRAQQKAEKNEPLTLDELRKMEGEPVWVVVNTGIDQLSFWTLVEVCEESIFLTNNLGGRTEYAADVELEADCIMVYRRKPKEES